MEFKEYNAKRNEITKELHKLEMEYVNSKTKLKVGNTVKFVKKGDYYIGEEDETYKGEIYRFEVRSDGKISVHCKGIHYNPLLENVTKCRS